MVTRQVLNSGRPRTYLSSLLRWSQQGVVEQAKPSLAMTRNQPTPTGGLVVVRNFAGEQEQPAAQNSKTASALADEYLVRIRTRDFIAGSKKMLALLGLCEDRADLDKALEALRLSRGVMHHRKQFKPYNTEVTNQIIKKCLLAQDPELLLDLIKDKNSLGLKFSKKKIRNLARTHFTRKEHFKTLEEAGKVRDLYEILVIHPHQESEISLSMVRAFFSPVVHHAESEELAMEFASDLQERFGIDGKAIVEEYRARVQKEQQEQEKEQEQEKVEEDAPAEERSQEGLGKAEGAGGAQDSSKDEEGK